MDYSKEMESWLESMLDSGTSPDAIAQSFADVLNQAIANQTEKRAKEKRFATIKEDLKTLDGSFYALLQHSYPKLLGLFYPTKDLADDYTTVMNLLDLAENQDADKFDIMNLLGMSDLFDD